MYKISENPLTRFPIGRELEEDCGNWAVAHLKSRREKTFVQELAEREIGYYLPLYENRVRRKDTGKIRKSINPLFPGYVAFVKSEATKKILCASGHVANVIEIKDQESFVSELHNIQRILGKSVSIEKSESIPLGRRVRIVFGPFVGMEGIVVEWRNTAKVGIGVQMFGQAILVEVESSYLVEL